ncbi:MAG: hypothetical protein ACOYT4_04870 [Nanoarchaeota archaeon]
MDPILERNLEMLAKNDAFEISNTFFICPSGQITPLKINPYAIHKDGTSIELSIYSFSKFISSKIRNAEYDVITGEESSLLFSMNLAKIMIKPHTILHKNLETLGADLNQKRIIHISYVNSDGFMMENYWAPLIKSKNGKLGAVFFYIDNMETGEKIGKNLNIFSNSFLQMNQESISYLAETKKISSEQFNILLEYLADRKQWTKKMLNGKKGLNYLKELIESTDKENQDKALNFISRDFYNIKKELKVSLKKMGCNISDYIQTFKFPLHY